MNEMKQTIVDFLTQNPDFFDQHPDLLRGLEITHDVGDGAVSLLQRQNQALRSQLEKEQEQLRKLIEVARDNERLNRRLHCLTLTLITAPSLEILINMLLDDLRQEFLADAVELKLFSAERLEQAVNQGKTGPLLFEDFMRQGKPRCGVLKKEQMLYLFGELAGETGSVALVPLRHRKTEGILAIGSRDVQRFHPGRDTEFLNRLGELVSHSLSRFGDDALHE